VESREKRERERGLTYQGAESTLQGIEAKQSKAELCVSEGTTISESAS
jgi:hypothetical protein